MANTWKMQNRKNIYIEIGTGFSNKELYNELFIKNHNIINLKTSCECSHDFGVYIHYFDYSKYPIHHQLCISRAAHFLLWKYQVVRGISISGLTRCLLDGCGQLKIRLHLSQTHSNQHTTVGYLQHSIKWYSFAQKLTLAP